MFEQASDPGGSSTLLVHIIDHAVNRINDIMNEKHDLWEGKAPFDSYHATKSWNFLLDIKRCC